MVELCEFRMGVLVQNCVRTSCKLHAARSAEGRRIRVDRSRHKQGCRGAGGVLMVSASSISASSQRCLALASSAVDPPGEQAEGMVWDRLEVVV